MKDDIKEQISAFIDNESFDQGIIDELKNDDELRATMARYSLVGDVLNNRYATGSQSLATSISHSLEAEATLIAPKQWVKKPAILKQTAGLAVAATVATVAILLVGNFSPTTTTDTRVAIGPITEKPIRMTSEVQRKLNGYLVSHTEYSASSQMKGMLPYTRIASFAPGERLRSSSASTQTGVALEE